MRRFRPFLHVLVAHALVVCAASAPASNHLDTPSVIANPSADIGDLYAWITPDGRRLALVMTIVGRKFDDRLRYVFHVDRGERFPETTSTTTIACAFPSPVVADCGIAGGDRAAGDATDPAGLVGRGGHLRVFAGLRDDPFFNNVRGTRDAYQRAIGAIKAGAAMDGAGCPQFDADTAADILDRWRHTDGGPAKNFLAGWTSSAIVITVDLAAVRGGGPLLAVWSETASADGRINRVGRPLTGNSLLATLGPTDVGNAMKEDYNRASPATAQAFIPEIEKGLGVYDGLDGHCGNQLMADVAVPSSQRYRALATMLADDRLWVNSTSSTCTQLFAVELAARAGRTDLAHDCGGRAPDYDASNTYRSLLVAGTLRGIGDGLDHDEIAPSTEFPFLAPPVPVAERRP